MRLRYRYVATVYEYSYGLSRLFIRDFVATEVETYLMTRVPYEYTCLTRAILPAEIRILKTFCAEMAILTKFDQTDLE
eukprot:scaffold644208_cov20-Prasinocladus_malaysianus.AAC.1